MSQPLLYLLLPVKDGADYLAQFLQSAAKFADGVIALDDGSTDGTVEILRDPPWLKRSDPMRRASASASGTTLRTAMSSLSSRSLSNRSGQCFWIAMNVWRRKRVFA